MSEDTLWVICNREYFPRNLKLRSEKTKFQYKLACADFERYLGHAPTLADLCDDTFAGWLKWLLEHRELAERTANERAGRVKSLWNWLARRGRIECFPTVDRVPVPETMPLAWSQDELRRLFAASTRMPGKVGEFRAGVWWPCLLGWLWCTGERIGATLKMEWEMIDLEAAVAKLPAKIRKQGLKSATYHLWPDVVELLRHIQRPTGKVFPWSMCPGSYWLHYNRLLNLAQLPGGRRRKSHAIRVSFATHTQAAGGDATARLMHSSPATTRASYLDLKFLRNDSIQLFKPWE
jgi:integrase